ncbi:hypothetical protein [Hyphomicrobium sp.]|jgi:hypothetical protein|uniref:hypothetical protein n=1 Tax=Hyphomicrobium sp. TaxID=82 RepID=UPI00356AFCD6
MQKLLFVFALSILLGAALNGCGDAQPQQKHAEQRSGLTKVGAISWLTPQDDVRPEVWLIEHETTAGSKPSTGDAGEVHRSLVAASEKFHDTPRMIANRAVQLERMLKEEGGDETAIVLISRLNGAVAPGRIESFGAAGQQYYNMRKAGFTGEQAIDALSKRYGSPS